MIYVGDFEYNPANILGNGAFAIVYEGRFKQNHEHKVAIKAMRSSDRNLAKSKNLLNKEIAVLRDLDHPNIVRLYDHKINSDGVFLFMEYCNGGDLSKILSERRTLPEDVISNLLAQLSSALDVMNLQGIMHRDLKPGNILLCFPPDIRFRKPSFEIYKSRIKYKLADFGFARFLQDGIMAATMCGSPMYMAPEVLLCKNYTITVDIWSMGVIIYQCLTGVAPFQANNPEALKAIYQKPLEPVRFPAHASNYLRDVIKKMLIKNPHNRISFKEIMQHPFVRGNVTVDPPRRQSHAKGDLASGQPKQKAKTLAEIFGTSPPATAPPPPAYATSGNKVASNNRPTTIANNNNVTNNRPIPQTSQKTSSSAIPIPANNNQHVVTTSSNKHTKVPAGHHLPEDDQDFIFVNQDGSVGKQRDIQRIFGGTSKTEKSENLLEKLSRHSNLDQDQSTNDIDSGHTSSNTGVYGSYSSTGNNQRPQQPPFKLASQADEVSSGTSPNVAVTSRTSPANRISPLRARSETPNSQELAKTPNQQQPGFYLSGTPPSPSQKYMSQSPTTPVPTAATTFSSGNRENSIPNMLRKNSVNYGSFNQQNENITEPKKSPVTYEEPKEIDIFEEGSGLDDDAICSNEHREESQKITAVLDMCELLFDLAEQRNALLSRPAPGDEDDEHQSPDEQEKGEKDSSPRKTSERKRNKSSSNNSMLDVISSPQRIAEQMLIYQRILSYLHTLFQQVRSVVEDKKRLCPTRTVCENIRACNNLYHRCIIKLDLLIKETEQNSNFGKVIMSWYFSLSVNKMVYHYSLDQCSAAEMDAMVGGLDMCIRRYQAAMLLMLGLRQHAKSDADVKLTKDVNELMQNRFIKHWYAMHDSPTVEDNDMGLTGDDHGVVM